MTACMSYKDLQGLTGVEYCVWHAAKRGAKSAGNPGKPGKKLRLEDLQSQFGVGLKEAANRLGICPTTLKVDTLEASCVLLSFP